jgi:probable F420-dependent oxidoreductase
MKFALHFANFTFPAPALARRVAVAAEQAGFESMLCIEHVAIPTEYESVYPYGPDGRFPGGPSVVLPDPLIWRSYVAAVTSRIRLMTGVLILPQRNPLVLAKEVATLDYLSEGRVSLGIGIGWLREEFEAIGVPFEGRGTRAEEHVAAMRALWAADDAGYQGRYVRFTGMSCNPKPAQARLPIFVGGHSPAAARRAGRIGDGYFPAIGRQVDLPALFEIARASAREHGRDPAEIELTAGCPDVFGDDPLGAVAARAEIGVHRIAVPGMAFTADPERALGEFGERVIARAG